MYNPGDVDYNLGRVPPQLLDHIQRECYEEWMDVRPECCFSPFPRCVAVSIHQPVCDLGALPVFVRRIPRLYHRWSQSHPHHAQRTHHHHPPPTRPSHLLSPDLFQYPNRWSPSPVTVRRASNRPVQPTNRLSRLSAVGVNSTFGAVCSLEFEKGELIRALHPNDFVHTLPFSVLRHPPLPQRSRHSRLHNPVPALFELSLLPYLCRESLHKERLYVLLKAEKKGSSKNQLHNPLKGRVCLFVVCCLLIEKE